MGPRYNSFAVEESGTVHVSNDVQDLPDVGNPVFPLSENADEALKEFERLGWDVVDQRTHA